MASPEAQPSDPVGRIVGAVDAGLGRGSGGLLRLEDAVLLLWLVAGGFLGRLAAGGPDGSGGAGGPLSSEADAVSGILWVGSAVLAVVVVATRSPGDPVLGFEGMATPRSYAPLPFLLSVAIVLDTGLGRLGIASDLAVGAAFLVTLTCYVAYPHLPVLPRATRRLLILPFILVAGTVFGGIVSDLSGLFDYRSLLGDPSATPGSFAALLGLDVLFSAMFYLAFIFAPRMVAEAEGTWRAWLARYAVFLGATIVGVTLLGWG
jgi:hypothetical protein